MWVCEVCGWRSGDRLKEKMPYCPRCESRRGGGRVYLVPEKIEAEEPMSVHVIKPHVGEASVSSRTDSVSVPITGEKMGEGREVVLQLRFHDRLEMAKFVGEMVNELIKKVERS